MKARFAVLALTGLMTVAHAQASDEAFGAFLGGISGAVVGHSVGGHDGAVVGTVLGAVLGAAIADDHDAPPRVQPVRYGPPLPPPGIQPVRYGPPPVYYREAAYVMPPPPPPRWHDGWRGRWDRHPPGYPHRPW